MPDCAALTPLYTIEDIAARLGVDRDAVSRWIASGELAAINVNRARNAKRPTWRIRPEDLEVFEVSRRSPSRPPKANITRRCKPRAASHWF